MNSLNTHQNVETEKHAHILQWKKIMTIAQNPLSYTQIYMVQICHSKIGKLSILRSTIMQILPDNAA